MHVLNAIKGWHLDEIKMRRRHAPGTRVIMGCPIWGSPFVEQFLRYSLPSIIAPANREALDAAGWWMVVYTDAAGERALRPEIERLGLPCALRRLPPLIMDEVYRNGTWKYPLLAAVHNLLIHEAADAGAGFHMMVADTVYSDHYLARVLALAEHHAAIAHTGFAPEAWTVIPELEAYRQGDALVVPAADLGSMGWRHLNPQWRSWAMDEDIASMPNSHYVYYRTAEAVHIHCAHQSAAWIGPERCRQVSSELGGTLDSELPRYMAGDFYTPTLADEMVYFVLVNGQTVVTPRVPFDEFKAEFWRFIDNKRDFVPYFARPCPVPVPRDDAYPSASEVGERLQRLLTALGV